MTVKHDPRPARGNTRTRLGIEIEPVPATVLPSLALALPLTALEWLSENDPTVHDKHICIGVRISILILFDAERDTICDDT